MAMSEEIFDFEEKLNGYLPLVLQHGPKHRAVRVSHGQGAGGPGKVLHAPGASAAGKNVKVSSRAVFLSKQDAAAACILVRMKSGSATTVSSP